MYKTASKRLGGIKVRTRKLYERAWNKPHITRYKPIEERKMYRLAVPAKQVTSFRGIRYNLTKGVI